MTESTEPTNPQQPENGAGEPTTSSQQSTSQAPTNEVEDHATPPGEEATIAPNLVQSTAQAIKAELQKVVVGMDDAIEQALAAMFIDGHVLFEGFPGVAKTMLVKLTAQAIDVEFTRIQFTPDLMPSDVIGTNIFDQQKSAFTFRKGPIFSNLILIDEINRAPAKTQSALFEAMEERQVTVEGTTHPLTFPFLVIATQNPIDQEGTYRLPEAQLDRFLFRIKVPYPTAEQESEILHRFKDDFQQTATEAVKHVAKPDVINQCREFIQKQHIEPAVIEYITAIAQATRDHNAIYLGASPRATLAIMKAAKAFAAMAGRNYVLPDDVQKACYPVLNHRIMISATAEMEGYSTEDIIQSILEDIEVPR